MSQELRIRHVNLQEDIHISLVSRIKYTILLKPHSATICYRKIRQNPDIPVKIDYQFSAVGKGFVHREPGLQVVDSVTRLRNDRNIPILVTNYSNKFI